MARDARMFTIGGGTAQVLRNFIAGRVLEWKLPQTRDGYVERGPNRMNAAKKLSVGSYCSEPYLLLYVVQLNGAFCVQHSTFSMTYPTSAGRTLLKPMFTLHAYLGLS